MQWNRRGAAMRNCVAVVTCAGIAACMFVTMAVGVETQSRLQVCVSRLKRISETREMYSNDYAGLMGTFQSVVGPRQWGSLGLVNYANSSASEIQSVADHAVDLIRRRGARDDIQRITIPWIASPTYGVLVLADYLGESLPSPNYACPEDANLLAWQSDPRNFNNLGVPSPVAPGGLTNADKRWPYTSSYTSGSSMWTNDLHGADRGAWYFNDASTYIRLGNFTNGRGDIGHRRIAEVAHPSRKVAMWDRGARHFTPRAVYWNFPNTKQPILYFDGGVRTTRTDATDPGWEWNTPNNPNATHAYSASFEGPNMAWFPGPPDGPSQNRYQFNASYFATTRGGLGGADLQP